MHMCALCLRTCVHAAPILILPSTTGPGSATAERGRVGVYLLTGEPLQAKTAAAAAEAAMPLSSLKATEATLSLRRPCPVRWRMARRDQEPPPPQRLGSAKHTPSDHAAHSPPMHGTHGTAGPHPGSCPRQRHLWVMLVSAQPSQ